MLGKIFAILVSSSFIFAGISGNMANLGGAVMSGADSAVKLSGSMLGVMCLWSGIIRVLDKAGFTALLSRIIAPFLRLMYPKASKNERALEDIAADCSANLLGLGNAALPLGIRAMNSLKKCSDTGEETASGEMITFAVLNTAPFQLMPTTLISLKSAHNSISPSEIILPVWICSLLVTVFGVMICRVCARVSKE